MRLLHTSLMVSAFTLSVGCKQIDDWRDRMTNRTPASSTPVKQVNADQLVTYLNGQSSRLNTLTYADARVTAREGLMSYTVRGNLAASQPRYFHMTGQGGAMGGKVDLGSNPEQFWMYIQAPTMGQTFVYASHSDFEGGRAKLPVPFEPDWVMQALGMTTFPDAKTMKYDVKMDEKARTYTLSWPATTPTGMPIRKEIVFSADDADSGRDQPQVKRHVMRDARGRVICTAEVKSAKTVQTNGTDPATNRPFVVQYPTRVVLKWEEQKFEMDMELREARVNPQLSPEQIQSEFTRPKIAGATPIDLATHSIPLK
jgi:hypothetical protein